MASASEFALRGQLLDRRRRLAAVSGRAAESVNVQQLLDEVDAALIRMETGTYGRCEVCGDPIEPGRLLADPTTRFCLDHLTPHQQRALEDDIALAARIQRELLPKPGPRPPGWEFGYHYAPAGAVSGDYCDVVPDERGGFFFAVGDVTGKGVAASMLMSHLHAMFRALLPVNIGLPEMIERASRVFCESTLPTHFATLAGGLAAADGTVEVCNAGHPPPLWLHRGVPVPLESNSLPIGLFCNESFATSRIRLEPNDLLLLYTDGVVETQNARGEDYGVKRLSSALAVHGALDCDGLLAACLGDAAAFGASADDLTLLAIRKVC